MIIGITGGIGSGKSTVAEMFQKKGALLYNSDLRAKELIQTDQNIIHLIIKNFGNKAYINGIYNTSFIASVVFNNKYLLKRINEITHPAVLEDFKKFCVLNESKTIVYESALMIETGHYKLFDKVILVTAPLELKINRILNRQTEKKDTDRELVLKRIHNQWSDEIKMNFSDIIIENIEINNTQKKVDLIWRELKLK